MILGTFSIDLLSDTEFLLYKLPKTGQGMMWAEVALFIDLIRGGYLWGGVTAKVFATSRTIQQARRDKMKTCDYICQITVERLAAAQAWLQDLDLAAQKCPQKKENPVPHGQGMICQTNKYHTRQHGLEQERAPSLVPPCQCSHLDMAHRMIIIQYENPQNLNMTLRKLMIPKKMGMEMILQYALI